MHVWTIILIIKTIGLSGSLLQFEVSIWVKLIEGFSNSYLCSLPRKKNLLLAQRKTLW